MPRDQVRRKSKTKNNLTFHNFFLVCFGLILNSNDDVIKQPLLNILAIKNNNVKNQPVFYQGVWAENDISKNSKF